MTAASCGSSPGSARSAELVVPARARGLAGGLAALFERDVELVKRLNDAQHRLHDANDWLWSGLSPDAFGLVYDGAAPAGASQIAALMSSPHSARRPDAEISVLGALQQIHRTIRRAFHDYQLAGEERRRLAVEVGELSAQLTESLCGAGWNADDAQEVDVHQLARGGIR